MVCCPHPNPPPRGREQSGEMARICPRLPFGASRCLRRKRQLNELRKDPLPHGGGLGWGQRTLAARHGPFTYTMSAQMYVNHQTAPSPRGGGLGWGQQTPRRATLPIYIHHERSDVCKPPNSPLPRGGGTGWGQRTLAARHGPFTYTTSAQVYVNHQTAPSPVGEGWGGVCWQTSPLQGEARSGGRCRPAKRRAFVPASRSALPVVYAGSGSLMNCGKTPSPRGGGLGRGLLANLETPSSPAGRIPQRGKQGRGQQTLAVRHCPFTYTTSARVYVNHQTAPSRDMAHLYTP